MGHHTEPQCDDVLRQLQTLLAVLGNYGSWLVSWCRAQLGLSLYAPRGFYLNQEELRCLNQDTAELQAQEMAGSPNDPIVAGTDYYEYRTFDGNESITKPGISVPATTVIGISFKPDLCAFPFRLIAQAIRSCCVAIGCSYQQFLIPHFGEPCEDLLRLVNSMMNLECKTEDVAQHIACWRMTVRGLLQGLNTFRMVRIPVQTENIVVLSDKEIVRLFDEDTLQGLRVNDLRLNRKVRRPVMLEILNRTDKTAGRWEAVERTPHGIFWPRPEKPSGNLLEYFLPAYLASLQELLPILRAEDVALTRKCLNQTRGIRHSEEE